MLIRKDLEFQDRESCQCDPVGRYFNKLQDRLDGIASRPEQKVVIGGDLNVTFILIWIVWVGRQPKKSQLSYLKKFVSIWTSLIPEE